MKALTLFFAWALSVLPVRAAMAERIPWTSSRVHGTPDPPLRYVTERVFPSVSFTEPVDMAYLPGTDWLYVMELTGKVYAFDGSAADPELHPAFDARTLFEQHNHSYGLTFHPDVSRNRFVYLSWTVPGQLVDDGTTVSRFELSNDDPPRIVPITRTDIIQWPSGGHNGACLKFGPDGYLYISAGDGVGPFPPDLEETGQDLSDLRATIMRIDVDRQTADRNYVVPADNPFVDLPEARPEVWAYGFRNPWKMNFSPDGSELFAGDVGWELWELVYRVVKGGNYGWSVMEGRQPIRSDVERGPTPIIPPLADHHHVEARSVTGGFVYRGERLPELRGAYFYGDYVTGKIWAIRNEENKLTWQEELADTSIAIITFGENEQGDLFIVDYAGGLHRLISNPRFGQETDFPGRLSETGLFADVKEQVPATGVLPYSLIAEPWMEGAAATRFVALPGTTSIANPKNREQWVYPPGTVFAKTVSLPERMLETQLLHYDGEDWRPYTYIWNDEQTDALLAPKEGSHTTVNIDGQEWTWRFHSRSECNTCHTHRGGFTLGFFPQNLNLAGDSGSDQLAEFVDLDLFATPVPERELRRGVVDPYDESADLDARARSYLMLNCAHCHRRGGGGTAFIEFPFEKPLASTNSINAPPTQGAFSIPHARIIDPGDPYRSVLYYRMATVGRGHMPHLGARRVDDAGLALIHDWIDRMDTDETESQTSWRRMESAVAALALMNADPHFPPDRIPEGLMDTTTQALQVVDGIATSLIKGEAADAIITLGASHEDFIIRGLFERFLPESERTKRLGTIVNPADILALSGDADSGRSLFESGSGVQCRNCHQIGSLGREVGPKLDDVGSRLTRDQILESILEPSRKVDAKWVGQTVLTSDGRVLTGLIRDRNADRIILRDGKGKDHEIVLADIEESAAEQRSLMPELLVQDLTAEQLADLLAFLSSLTAE